MTEFAVDEKIPLFTTKTGVKAVEVTTPPARGVSLTYNVALTVPVVVTRRAAKETW